MLTYVTFIKTISLMERSLLSYLAGPPSSETLYLKPQPTHSFTTTIIQSVVSESRTLKDGGGGQDVLSEGDGREHTDGDKAFWRRGLVTARAFGC